MNKTLNLSRRLELIASFISQGAVFADIGSDHAYLPCYVCLQDEEVRAIAGEINTGPMESARRTVAFYHLTDRIDVRLGDGLNILKDGEVDTIVIAGMGGSLINAILSSGYRYLSHVNRIIVQPNVNEYSVRHWMQENGYSITNECMVEENGHIYEIIVADKQKVTEANINTELTEKRLMFGPCLLAQKPDLFYQKWKLELNKRLRIIRQMKKARIPDNEKIAAFEKETLWIEEALET